MAVDVSVAPPDGWERWSARRYAEYNRTNDDLSIPIDNLSSFNRLKLTVFAQLEGKRKAGRFPIFDRLAFDQSFIRSDAVPALRAEARTIASELRKLPSSRIVSPRLALDRLDYQAPTPDFLAESAAAWQAILAGQVRLPRLTKGQLSNMLSRFRKQFPRRPRDTVFDLYFFVFAAFNRVTREAQRLGRGILLVQ